jgi:hypothetical protein
MTPTNTDVAAKIYSNKFIAGATKQLAPLKAFSLDLSEEAKNPGETVQVPMISADSAETWNDTTANFSRTTATLGDRTVTLGTRKIAGFGITPAQMANFNKAWWEGKAELNAAEIANAILDTVVALVTGANFGDAAADKLTVSLAGFNAAAVSAIRAKAINAKKLRINRSVLALNPEFFSALLGSLPADVYGGREAMVNGVIPGLLGFGAVIELPQMSTPGFVSSPAALCVAGRTVAFLGTKNYEKVQTFVEPETGMPMTNVIYVDGPTGKGSMSVSALYGAAVGADDQLLRLI